MSLFNVALDSEMFQVAAFVIWAASSVSREPMERSPALILSAMIGGNSAVTTWVSSILKG